MILRFTVSCGVCPPLPMVPKPPKPNEKNKTGKYLKHAIGEIVSVAIGFLIDLQINNWNEQQKAKTITKAQQRL